MIVPGGGAPTIRAMGNQAVGDYLRQAADTVPVVGSVCTGALVLAAAGLLEGRTVTTHWAYHRLLERLGGTYLPQRWVEDGKFITSAGVSACGRYVGLHRSKRCPQTGSPPTSTACQPLLGWVACCSG